MSNSRAPRGRWPVALGPSERARMRAHALLSASLTVFAGACGGNGPSGPPTSANAAGSSSVAGNGGLGNTAGGSSNVGGSEQTGSGGSANQGGTSGSGGSAGSPAGGTGGAPPHNVGACDDLAPVGTWEQIAPPVDYTNSDGKYGILTFVLDPQNSGTLIVGTSSWGIWKTTNCGADWLHVNTGKNGDILDNSRQWGMLIDPTDPQVIYANAGYGGCGSSGLCTDGALKSTNGGVDWEPMWPPADKSAIEGAPGSGNEIRMDPTDPTHLAIGLRGKCVAKDVVCWGESHDAGETWSVILGKPEWVGAKSSIWLLGGENMIVATEDIGLWHTSDGGTSFEKVADNDTVGHSPGQLYISPDAGYYFGSTNGVLHSPDGVTWSLIPDSGQHVGGVIGDGTTLYQSTSAQCFDAGTDLQVYRTAPEDSGSPWAPLSSPGMKQGGWLGYDADHKVLYSSNCTQGFWRVVVE